MAQPSAGRNLSNPTTLAIHERYTMGTFPFIVILVCVLGLVLSPFLFVYVFHHFEKRFEQKYQQLGNLVEIHVKLNHLIKAFKAEPTASTLKEIKAILLHPFSTLEEAEKAMLSRERQSADQEPETVPKSQIETSQNLADKETKLGFTK
jgi:hypothetical protein